MLICQATLLPCISHCEMVQEPYKEQRLIGIYHYITTAYNIMFSGQASTHLLINTLLHSRTLAS